METHYAHIFEDIVISVEVVVDSFVESNPERYAGFVKVNGLCGRGYSYSNNIFTAPQPFNSWVLKENKWEAPYKKPKGDYEWDQGGGKWMKLNG